MVRGAGITGVERACALLGAATNKPASVSYLCWGPDGYDPELPSGYDVRDHLTKGPNGPIRDVGDRIERLGELLAKVRLVPQEWLAGGVAGGTVVTHTAVEAPCTWEELISLWSKPRALRMRQELKDVLAVMLAVTTSTMQTGDQVFLQVLGPPGTAKTKFCDALLTADEFCYPLEQLTGFHSGWQDGSGQDFSLLSRVNGKTMITPEGDVLMSSPRFAEIMSQQRRIFDGTSGASYKNQKVDQRYTGLRTPWIIAGTPALITTGSFASSSTPPAIARSGPSRYAVGTLLLPRSCSGATASPRRP